MNSPTGTFNESGTTALTNPTALFGGPAFTYNGGWGLRGDPQQTLPSVSAGGTAHTDGSTNGELGDGKSFLAPFATRPLNYLVAGVHSL